MKKFVVVWEYEVKPECEERFEKFYGSDGDWVQFFRTDSEFDTTVLSKDPSRSHTYVTQDFWKSHAAYDSFKTRCAEKYNELDKEAEGMTVHERHLGSFEQA